MEAVFVKVEACCIGLVAVINWVGCSFGAIGCGCDVTACGLER